MRKILIVLSIFVFSIILRLWNLNAMGRTWDEEAYVEWGNTFINLLKKGDFTNLYWYKTSDAPPLARYMYGIASIYDVSAFTAKGKPIFRYDYTHARLVSVLFSSLTVVLIVLLGWRYISPFVGITAGIILSMLPLLLGFSQIATLESFIIFFFTATIFSFFNLLTSFSKKNILLTGFLLGLALEVKYTNILLVPLMIWIYAIWHAHVARYRKAPTGYPREILAIFLIAFVTFFVLWPMPWFHLEEVFIHNANLRHYPYSVPEVFFGKLILVPKVYYIVYFLITTPLLIIIFFILGLVASSGNSISYFNPLSMMERLINFMISMIEKFSFRKLGVSLINFFLFIDKKVSNKKSWVIYAIIAWFSFPFIQSLYNFKQHGLRYIIEVYAPLSLIAAIGLDYLAFRLRQIRYIKVILLTILGGYLFFILVRISPYYLDYFNEVVGGTKKVYEKRMFQLGWWGQGIREAAFYVVNNAQRGASVGIALSPVHVMPALPQQVVKTYKPNEIYDYVIVNYYNILREGFDDNQIKKYYNAVYYVDADGAKLVTVYKRK